MLASAIKPTRRAVLSLYARIFRLHRAKLPIEMKKLGDSYVRCVCVRACGYAGVWLAAGQPSHWMLCSPLTGRGYSEGVTPACAVSLCRSEPSLWMGCNSCACALALHSY